MNEKSRSLLERFTDFLGSKPHSKETLIEVLREAKDRDIVSGEMLSQLIRILHVAEMQVREIMVPKAQMIAISEISGLKDILPIVIESAHSRFPVLSADNETVLGVMLAKDLLKYTLHDDEPFQIKNMMRPVLFTPQSKRLDILLREFRTNRNHMAIVLDEYSHIAGLVTLEDVLEQIVGEIEDEYDIDEEDTYIKKIEKNTFIVKAVTPIEAFNAALHTRFNDDEFDTIGGIVLKNFGHLPKRGENIKIKNISFKVLQSDNRRLYLLEVKRPGADSNRRPAP